MADIGYSELDLPAVMGVNGSIALRRSHPHLRFAYYAMLDAGFVSRRRDLVADVLAQDLLLFVTPEVLRGIAQLFSPDDIRCRIAVFEEVHQRAYLPRAQPEQLARTLRDDPDLVLFDAHAPIHPLGFSLDPARGLFGGGTVAYSALQLLVWLGFRTLYLHGLDLRGASVSPRFYESADARLPSALDRQFDSHIRPAFRDASRLLGARGLRIYNLSPGSALDERVSQAPLDDAETARASVLTRAAAILVRSRPLHAHSLYQFPPGRRRRPYHHVLSLVRALRAAHDIVVAAPAGSRLFLEASGMPGVRVVPMEFKGGLLSAWPRIRRMRALLKIERFDLVHVNGAADHRLCMLASMGLGWASGDRLHAAHFAFRAQPGRGVAGSPGHGSRDLRQRTYPARPDALSLRRLWLAHGEERGRRGLFHAGHARGKGAPASAG